VNARVDAAVLRGSMRSAAVALATAAVLAFVEGWSGVGHLTLAAVVAIGMLLDVDLPQGGSVPMGHALVMGLAYAMPSDEFALVTALGLLLCLPVLARRHGSDTAARRTFGFLLAASASGAVGAGFRWALPAGVDPYAPKAALLGLLLGGIGYLAVDLLVSLRHTTAERRSLADWQVYVSLLCAAALLGMAYHEGWWMLLFAALPLLMTRFSFQRYSTARRTYQQTIQALAIVPELAGHAPLGHGERTAAYAGALATEMGVEGAARERLLTAARLHHIGHISIPEYGQGDDTADGGAVGRAGADMLRETGFLAPVADLVETVGRPPEPGEDDVAATIVRIATAFDELVLESPERGPGALALLASQHRDEGSQRAIAELRRLVTSDTSIVSGAIADGAPLTQAAAAAARKHADV
jgi:hypothetical protein